MTLTDPGNPVGDDHVGGNAGRQDWPDPTVDVDHLYRVVSPRCEQNRKDSEDRYSLHPLDN